MDYLYLVVQLLEKSFGKWKIRVEKKNFVPAIWFFCFLFFFITRSIFFLKMIEYLQFYKFQWFSFNILRLWLEACVYIKSKLLFTRIQFSISEQSKLEYVHVIYGYINHNTSWCESDLHVHLVIIEQIIVLLSLNDSQGITCYSIDYLYTLSLGILGQD